MFKALYVAGMALILASCSSVNSNVGDVFGLDKDLKLSFVALPDVNPDESETPSPVIIRMYELSSVKAFKNANFIDLYERDADILGKSMLSQQSLKPIKPGEQSHTNFVLGKETKFIGLYVEFLQYEDAKYKLTIPIEKSNVISASSKIQLSGNNISLLE